MRASDRNELGAAKKEEKAAGWLALRRRSVFDRSHQNSTMRFLLLCVLLSGLACSALRAEEKLQFVSPDGKFAVRLEPQADDEAITTINLVEVSSGTVLMELEALGHPWIDEIKLLWAPDSRRAAFLTPGRRGGWTTLYARKGDTFEEVEMPELIHANMKSPPGAKTVLAARVPIRWTKPNVLILENNVEDTDGNSGTSRMLLTFDAKNHVTVTRAKK
jgi:hypothetical protein